MTLSPPHTHSQAFACGSPGRAPAPPPPAASGIRQPGPRSRRHSRSESRPTARRHVILPKHVSKNAPKGRLLSESEWRGLGVQQSRGWVHYAIHRCAQRPTREPIWQLPRRCCPRTPAASPRRAVPPTCLRAPCDTHTRHPFIRRPAARPTPLSHRRVSSCVNAQAGAAHPALPAPAGHRPDHWPRPRQAH